MYLINNVASKISPFLIQSVEFEDKLFTDMDYSYSTISPYQYKNATGNSSTCVKKNTLMATFGEYNERFTLFHNMKSTISELDAFSLFDNKRLKISPKSVYLNYNLRGLKDYNFSFADSCGVASHLTSEKALKAGMLEFIERQSLIVTWLSKIPGRQYAVSKIITLLDENVILKKFNKYFSFLKIYDISIYQGIYVILILGSNGRLFSIGLNASNSLKNAVTGALDEFEQTYKSMLIRNYNDRKLLSSKDSDLYRDSFFNEDCDSFMKKYNFLSNSEEKEIQDDVKSDIKSSLLKIPINYYAVAIKPEITRTNLRIVKVFSPQAYLHMNTRIIDPSKVQINNFLKIRSFPNKGKLIPFP